MALFRLRSQHTGTVRDFTLLDLLNFLGDTVNDEICFGEDVFNLSSFVGLDGGTGSNGNGSPSTRIITEYPLVVHGRLDITLERAPYSKATVQLNGVGLKEGEDYSRDGVTVSFPFSLNNAGRQQDSVQVTYDLAPQT